MRASEHNDSFIETPKGSGDGWEGFEPILVVPPKRCPYQSSTPAVFRDSNASFILFKRYESSYLNLSLICWAH